jgi:hypothetical protein
LPGVPTTAVPRRCPESGIPLLRDVGDGICPACLLRAGLLPNSQEPPTDGPAAADATSGLRLMHTDPVHESQIQLAEQFGQIPFSMHNGYNARADTAE